MRLLDEERSGLWDTHNNATTTIGKDYCFRSDAKNPRFYSASSKLLKTENGFVWIWRFNTVYHRRYSILALHANDEMSAISISKCGNIFQSFFFVCVRSAVEFALVFDAQAFGTPPVTRS